MLSTRLAALSRFLVASNATVGDYVCSLALAVTGGKGSVREIVCSYLEEIMKIGEGCSGRGVLMSQS